APVLPPRAREAVGGPIQRVVPRDLAPARTVPDQGSANAIGIVVKIGECGGLRTDVPTAERIIAIAADRPDLSVLDVDQNAARRLAQRTGRDPHCRQPGAWDSPEA